MTDPAPQTPAQPVFNPQAEHHRRPKLRAVRGFAARTGEQTALGLADARQISDKVVYTSPAAQLILPHLDGKKSVDEIVSAVGSGLTRPLLEGLIAQLDDAGLLFGPTFEAMLAKMRTDFDSAPVLPPASTAAMVDALLAHAAQQDPTISTMSDEQRNAYGVKRLRELLDEWMAAALKDAENPSLDRLPKAVVAPHVDYPRGWLNYASVWGRLRVTDRPDRVVVLGTNHFGESTGVCGCDKGYESPLGVCEADQDLIAALKSALGREESERLFKHRFDHEREHSVELQIPWIQHCLGAGDDGKFCRVFGALVHDPTVSNGDSYDGQGVSLQKFVDAMRTALATLPGRTLVVASADLAHRGQSFGDSEPLAGDTPEANEFRNRIFSHDREMVEFILQRQPDELIAAMSWQGNPNRWCSIGNIVATLKIVEPERVELYNFAAAMDPQGVALVSNVGMAMM